MGPFLFITYINDFERYLQGATPNMYVHDTTIASPSTDRASLQRKIDIALANVAERMRENRLSLNAKRVISLVIRHSRAMNSLKDIETTTN